MTVDKFYHSVHLDADLCVGCINCIKHCPTGAIRVHDGKAHINAKFCIDCGECIRICPHHAKQADYDSLEVIKERNEKKAKLLYDYLDSQDYYIAPVEKSSRSMMNVTFITGDEDLDKKFAKEAAANGLKNLKGHRSVGGMRASIYNAMPYEGVEKLVAFMKDFAEKNPK